MSAHNVEEFKKNVASMLDSYNKALHHYHLLLIDADDPAVADIVLDQKLNDMHIIEQMIEVRKSLEKL